MVNIDQSYGGAQAREVHPLEQLPPYPPASYRQGGQDYQRYTAWGDEDLRHGNTNGRTQSIDHTQDHTNSKVPPTNADWQDYCDTADNNRMMPDSCRFHTDNIHENDVAADPEEACVEACPTTEYTDDAQEEGKAPGTSDPTAPRQAHREAHTPSIAFQHLPPNSARFSYATEGALFISAQLSSDAVSALRKVWVLI